MRKDFKFLLIGLLVLVLIPGKLYAKDWRNITITQDSYEPSLYFDGYVTSKKQSGTLTKSEQKGKDNLVCDSSSTVYEWQCNEKYEDKPICRNTKWSKENPNINMYVKTGNYRQDCTWGGGKLVKGKTEVIQTIYNAYDENGSRYDYAYCLDPGTKFGPEAGGYTIEDLYQTSGCEKSNQGYVCALAGVFYKAEERGEWQYLVIDTAVRYVAAHYGMMKYTNNPSTSKVRVEAYKETATAILNNEYMGSTSGPRDNILYAGSSDIATLMQSAAQIYKEVMAGFSFNKKTAVKKGDMAYDATKKTLTAVVETNYEESEISSLTIKSGAFGDLTSVHGHEMKTCPDNASKKCLYITIPYDKSRITKDDKVEVNLSFVGQNEGNFDIAVYTYQPDPANYQKFLIYDKNTNGNEVEFEYDVHLESKNICKVIDGKYYGRNGNYLGTGPSAQAAFNKKGECHCVIEDGKYYVDYPGNGPVSISEYNRVCDDGTTTITCNPKIEYDMPSDCEEDGTKGTIKDPEICGILNNGSPDKNYKTDYGNEYCDIYCREELRFTFMDKETAIAGRYFKHDVDAKYSNIAYLSTVILSSRQCSSINIKYESWKSAYIAANNNVLDTWNTYKSTESQNKNAKSHSASASCSTCSSDSCCTTRHSHPSDCTYNPPEYDHETGKTIYPGGWDHGSHCVSGPGCGSRSRSWTWYTWDAYYQHTYSDGSTGIIDVSGSDGSDSLAADSCSCSGCGSCYGDSGSRPSIVNNYTQAVKLRDELVDKINSCNFVEGSSAYKKIMNYTPKNTISIDYEENTKYGENYTVDIKNDSTPSKVVERTYGLNSDWSSYCSNCDGDMSNLSKTSTNEHLTYWECSGSQAGAICKDVTSTVFPMNKVANIVIEKETLHYQNAQFYTQVYTGKVSTSKNNVGYWITMEPHVYPVGVNRKTGEYKIELEYSNLGGNSNRGVKKFNNGDFTCAYQVVNELNIFDCDDGYHECPEPGDDKSDLGVYFRSIDLNDVFPNSVYSPNSQVLHSTRKVGANWKTSNAEQVTKDIQKLGDNIWNKTPQYVITLSPSMINQIKKYNKNTSYLDYSLQCDSKLHCTSDFLEDDLRDIMSGKYQDYYSKDSTIKFNSLYYYKK